MQNDFMQSLAESMTPKFAVSYLRVSSRRQAERGGGADEGFSIPAQRDANKKKAHSMGAIIGKEFVDRGASARSADREGLQEMLEYIKDNAERIDYLIVHKVDRLARNRGDDVDIMRVLVEAGVQLVSASESIDNTPSGKLVHNIMSSIAEWYSDNLAFEVKKGLYQKVQDGGSVSKAPIGYLNVRKVDEVGREYRTVELDEERAPFVKQAFEEYATGKWTVSNLAEHLALGGFTTRATPKIPSAPVSKGTLNKILINPYYKGTIVYKGVEYAGKHSAITDEETWCKVQAVLLSHLNGERTREHPHFLKSSLFCGTCGSRMIVQYAKSKSGVRYPYYMCAGRHSKRAKDCKMKSILIQEVEEAIVEIYENHSLDPNFRKALEAPMIAEIEKSQKQFKVEQDRLRKEKEKLERNRKKLLEAHLNDAIPIDLLKSKQAEITKTLSAIDNELKAHDNHYGVVIENLKKALDIIEDCGRTYRYADEHIKRILNQAMFDRLVIEPDGKTALRTAVIRLVHTYKAIYLHLFKRGYQNFLASV